jgi:hypothetical protein
MVIWSISVNGDTTIEREDLGKLAGIVFQCLNASLLAELEFAGNPRASTSRLYERLPGDRAGGFKPVWKFRLRRELAETRASALETAHAVSGHRMRNCRFHAIQRPKASKNWRIPPESDTEWVIVYQKIGDSD